MARVKTVGPEPFLWFCVGLKSNLVRTRISLFIKQALNPHKIYDCGL